MIKKPKLPAVMVYKDEKVICPVCKTPIATVLQDMFEGSKIDVTCFQFLRWNYSEGQQAVCKECQSEWCLNGALHVERGWVPYNPTRMH
jgi:hypothetical protein